MYENVIVPFDGTSTGRVALTPAADLAWRCGAHLVIVNNTDANDKASRAAIKSKAMTLSGADVDFWVDLEHSLGMALVEAAKFRANPVICISIPAKSGGLLRSKRWSLPPLAEDVLRSSPAPVLVIGPGIDPGRGLPLVEIVAATDGSAISEQIIPTAVTWARDLKLKFTLLGVVHQDTEDTSGEEQYLASQVAKLAENMVEARSELVRAPDPATGLRTYLGSHRDAILALTTYGRGGPGRAVLGSVATQMVEDAPSPVLLQRPSGA